MSLEIDTPELSPMDEFNTELLNQVRPPHWKNPTPKGTYQFVAIGAGAAGLISAAGAAGLGARVAIIERNLMGGDCLNVGCVPSKGVIRAARAWHAAAQAKNFGGPSLSGSGDFGQAMQRMRKLRAKISPVDSAQRFRDMGIDVFIGHATFTGPDTLEVGGQTLRFKKAVIATGARAAALPIPGLSEAGYLTNENFFNQTSLPPRLGIIGAGPIGCEMAQSFARFGSQVSLLDIGEHVLPREDADAAAIVQASMQRDGVNYIPSASIKEVERRGEERIVHYQVDGEARELPIDQLFLAVGRTPNIENLGLEAAGVQAHARGVEVDDRLRTSNKRIFAAGDICSPYQFTHAADAMARIVVQNALFFGRSRVSDLIIPWCTYTSPEIAHVGLYTQDAEAKGIATETLHIPLSEVDRALLDSEAEGFLKVHVRKGSDEILGATLVAEHAGEMIGELALAITAKVGLSKIAKTIHPYPTQGEVIKKAGDAWNRGKLTPLVAALFKGFFRIF